MNNVMIDLETMGTKNNAAIVSIGAVAFNPDGILDEFYRIVDLQSCIDAGLSIDAKTIYWWWNQEEAVRDEILVNVSLPLTTALSQLSSFIYDYDNSLIWGNGSNFDPIILESAYRAVHGNIPWNYLKVRCFRTIKDAFPVPYKIALGEIVNTEKHNALADARYQALYLMELWSQIQI